MLRTTRRACPFIAVITAFAALQTADARPAAKPSEQPYSIVAQSTSATAGTGRRPISQRIAASNLPLRTPSPPDCANGACPIATPAPDVDVIAAEPPLADADGERAEADPAVGSDAELATAESGSDETPTVQAPAPEAAMAAADATEAVAPEASPADADSASTETSLAADDAGDEITSSASPDSQTVTADRVVDATAEAAVASTGVLPVAAPIPEPAPTATVRDTLLKRIRGAFATRPRAAGSASGSPVSPSENPRLPADGQDAPRRIPVPAEATADLGQPTPADDGPRTPSAITMPAGDLVAASTGDAAAAPARLEFDVRESRSLVGEGEQIVMRIAVRNVGGETAERVTATLFFAEGIEPVQAIGHSAEVYPGEVRFEAVPELSPGSSVDLLVTAVGTRPGSVTYRGELECRQLAGRIAREGAVTVRARRVATP